MFAGIIQNQGKIILKQKKGGQIRFSIQLKRKEKSLRSGESMAVDGVCLTLVKVKNRLFEVDVVRETLQATTLGSLETGSSVNLERSLRFGDLVGGHLVSGHVDCVGEIVKIERQGRNQLWSFKAPSCIRPLLALKGSIAVDGISLTIQDVKHDIFKIALIPYTLRETTLGQKKVGDTVNLEVDLIARYLKRILEQSRGSAGSRVRFPTLNKQGF